MKTYKNLYCKVWAFDNLYAAYRRARKGKRGKPPAATFEWNLEENLFDLQKGLVEKTYVPGSYHSFYIHEPKRRLISAAPFRDRVVHHALCGIMEPILTRSFIHDSYANQVDKGTHRALDRCQAFCRTSPYVLQGDVRQFFPSIDHEILHGILGHVIADADVMWLIDRILQSGVGVLTEEYEMRWFPGDDLTACWRPRGLPIGNLTSQFWANVYLNELDKFVKRRLKCRRYIRYVDDFLLFGDDKRTMHTWREAVIAFLRRLRLTLHEGRAQVFPVTEGVPFLGFRVYPTHRRLKQANGKAFRRRLKGLAHAYTAGKIEWGELNASVLGWVNHVRYGDTWGLRRAIFSENHVQARGN